MEKGVGFSKNRFFPGGGGEVWCVCWGWGGGGGGGGALHREDCTLYTVVHQSDISTNPLLDNIISLQSIELKSSGYIVKNFMELPSDSLMM